MAYLSIDMIVADSQDIGTEDAWKRADAPLRISTDRKIAKKALTVGENPIQLEARTESMNYLELNGVRISAQDFGTRIALILQGQTKNIEERYFSLYNHGATSGELEWWCDNTALLWIWDSPHETATQKLEKAFAFAAHCELETQRAPKADSLGRALKIARQRLSQMNWVHWIEFTSFLDLHDFGTSVGAERSTGNFDDDVITAGLNLTNSTPDAKSLRKTVTETDPDVDAKDVVALDK